MRVTEMGASEGCPVIGQIEVASPHVDNITSPKRADSYGAQLETS